MKYEQAKECGFLKYDAEPHSKCGTTRRYTATKSCVHCIDKNRAKMNAIYEVERIAEYVNWYNDLQESKKSA